MSSPSVTSKQWRTKMYTYYVDSIHDMITITSSLLVRSIGFKVIWNEATRLWVIELTGAH